MMAGQSRPMEAVGRGGGHIINYVNTWGWEAAQAAALGGTHSSARRF